MRLGQHLEGGLARIRARALEAVLGEEVEQAARDVGIVVDDEDARRERRRPGRRRWPPGRPSRSRRTSRRTYGQAPCRQRPVPERPGRAGGERSLACRPPAKGWVSPLTDASIGQTIPGLAQRRRPRPRSEARAARTGPPRCAGRARAAGGGWTAWHRSDGWGCPRSLPRPATGWSTSTRSPRASTWGRSSASATVRTRPQGMPAASQSASHSSTVRVLQARGRGARAARRSWRRAARSCGSAGLRPAAGSPIEAQNARQSPSLPTASTTGPSAASNVS